MTSLNMLPKTSHPKRRRGRGIAAGLGKSAGRGTKGQKARSGARIPAGFEGGQTKLYRRLPKRRGEGNAPRPGKASVALAQLDRYFADGERVTVSALRTRGLVPANTVTVRVVGTGSLSKSLKFAGLSFTHSVYTQLYGKRSKIKDQRSK